VLHNITRCTPTLTTSEEVSRTVFLFHRDLGTHFSDHYTCTTARHHSSE
jgi:hypothetical protein